MAQSWIKKYEPTQPNQILGQDKPLVEINNFIKTFKSQKKKACLLYGPSGCGKTSSVIALAKNHNLEILEVNASDFRNADNINKKLGPALKTKSLFSKGKLILVDEIDGLSGRKDRGGIQAITKLITTSNFPIICTANNPWNSKFSSLRTKCNIVKCNPLNHNHIFTLLKTILDKEKITFQEPALKSLARRSAGDARAAINDIQSLSQINQGITNKSIDQLSERNKTESMLSALVKVFKNSDPEIALNAFNNVEEDLDKCILWIDENLPNEYKNKDLAKAYNHLSKADVYRGRIRRWQYWRFLVYVNALITAGIATSKSQKPPAFTQYKPTTRILKLWRAKMKFQKKKSIAEKLALKTHCSKNIALKQIPFIKEIFKNKHYSEEISQDLDLNAEEVGWLKK